MNKTLLEEAKEEYERVQRELQEMKRRRIEKSVEEATSKVRQLFGDRDIQVVGRWEDKVIMNVDEVRMVATFEMVTGNWHLHVMQTCRRCNAEYIPNLPPIRNLADLYREWMERDRGLCPSCRQIDREMKKVLGREKEDTVEGAIETILRHYGLL